MAADALNSVSVSGRLIERDALRYTPAGVPVLNFRLAHESEQIEAGIARAVGFEIQGVAIGPVAPMMAAAATGTQIRISGFLAAKSQRSRQPVLHVNTIEFVEETNHGIQAQNQG